MLVLVPSHVRDKRAPFEGKMQLGITSRMQAANAMIQNGMTISTGGASSGAPYIGDSSQVTTPAFALPRFSHARFTVDSLCAPSLSLTRCDASGCAHKGPTLLSRLAVL